MIPTNADCLIYNSLGTGTGRRFLKHILKGVFWDETKGVNTIQMGTTTANSINMYVDLKPEYVPADEWQLLTIAKAKEVFTIQNGAVLVFGTPDAPNEFTTTVQIDTFFGTENAHQIMSVDIKRLPSGEISHFEVAGA